MKCNLDGLLRNAAAELTDEDGCSVNGYAFALEELATNLREVRDRVQAGDMAVLKEFFSIYIFSESAPAAANTLNPNPAADVAAACGAAQIGDAGRRYSPASIRGAV